jgi:hypothetical protein
MMSSAPSPEYTWLRIDRPRSTLSCRHHPQARARHRKSSSREHAKTGLTASRISPPVVPCYEWRFDHPMRMGILSDQQEPKDLSLNSVTRSSRQAKTSQGRARLVRPGRIRGAGVHPRRKPTPLSPSTACAASPAQSPPYGVDRRASLQCDDTRLPSSNLRGANKGLMETHPNSEFEPNNCNHRHLTFSNRNSTHLFAIDKLESNRQLETIRNGRNPFKSMHMTFSNRLKKTESIFATPRESAGTIRLSNLQLPTSHLCTSNRPYRRLEFNISPTKQRTEVLSNRPKSADTARIGVLRDQRESKDLSFAFFKTNQPAALLRQGCGGRAGRRRYEEEEAAISWWMAWAAARGSGAAVIGRPTTR